jgi:flagellar biosynthesis protein FlhA
MEPRLEQLLATKVHRSPGEISLALDPLLGRHVQEQMARGLPKLTEGGGHAVLIVGTEIRLALRRFLEPSFPRLAVLAYQELPPATEVENAGIITGLALAPAQRAA